MESELDKLESELAGLRPAAPDAALVERLERAVEGRLQALSIEERELEGSLGRMKPSRPAESMMASMASVLDRLPFPGQTKVLPFPNATTRPAGTRRRRISWAAAAAVALAGGLSALMVGPGNQDQGRSELADRTAAEVIAPADPAAFSPASFESGVAHTDDLGRMWAGRERAMRVVKVVYKDRVVWLNEQGEEVVTEVPRVEYLMVPEEID